MRKMLKQLLALTLCMALMLGCVVTANAADLDGSDSDSAPAAGSITVVKDVTDIGEKIGSVKVTEGQRYLQNQRQRWYRSPRGNRGADRYRRHPG